MIKLSSEEKILKKILFTDKNHDSEVFQEINNDKLLKLTSKHLVVPSLYHNISKKKTWKLF